jgi:ABC-type multidrug transport system permease subunit
MRNALIITLKDLQLLARDRRALVVLIALPMVIIAIVGSSTGRIRTDGEKRRLGLHLEYVDLDRSETSKRLQHFLAGYEKVHIHASELTDEQVAAGIDPFLESDVERPADVRIVIGPDFESTLLSLERYELTAPQTGRLKDGLPAIDVHVVAGGRADVLTDGLTKALLKLALKDAMLPIVADRIPIFRGAARRSEVPKAWADSQQAQDQSDTDLRVYQFVVPSYTVLFVFFLVNIMGRSFITERELGTLRRLRIAPVSSGSILTGKTLPFLIVSLVQTMILMGCGRLLFGMSWGTEPWLLVPVILCTSLAATTLGLLFSTIVKTESQVSSFGNLLMLSTAGISGCLVPRAWMPELSQKISLMTPHAWALDAYNELLTNDVPDVSFIATRCGVLLLFSTVFFVFGLLRFRKTREQ